MADNVLLKISGLYSYPSRLGAVPLGALIKANNIFINRDSIAESRRGFKIYGSSMGSGNATNAKQLISYKDRLFRNWNTTLDYDSDGQGLFKGFSQTAIGNVTAGDTHITGFTTTSFLKKGMSITGTGIPINTFISDIIDNNNIIISNIPTITTSNETLTFTRVVDEVVQGLRIKSIEQNGNLYFTTADGIQKISAFATSDLSNAIITDAGVVPALDLQATLNSDPGFFTEESVIAYRMVWGVKDDNNNLLLGAPSSRVVIANPLTPLLITNFNGLLQSLDDQNVSSGIHTQNFVSTYKLPSNASSQQLQTNLINLTESIDGQIQTFTSVPGIAEVQTITTVADVSGNLNSTYFNIYTAQNTTQYYLWFSNGGGIDPGLVGKTGLEVPFTTNGSAASIASNVSAVLQTIGAFSTSISSNVITVTNSTVGPCFPAANGGISPGFSYAILTTGSGGPIVTSGTSYTVEWNVSSDPTNIIRAGDSVSITGALPSTFDTPTALDTYFTVTSVTSSSITYSQKSNPGVYASGNITIARTNYEAIPQPTTLDITPTTDELLSMQNYYAQIVAELQNEPSGIANNPALFNNNDITTSASVNLTFVIPQGITTAYFYQIYRTVLTTAASGTSLSSYDPGDEEGLVYEANPTLSDLNNGTITIKDITTDAFIGANLYTNQNSGDGQGIAGANARPPLAQDVATFKGYTFYSNTQTNQNIQLSLLSVSQLVSGVSTFTIADANTSNTYTFVLGIAQSQTITTVADVAGSLNSTYFLLSSGQNLDKFYVWYNDGSGVDPAIAGLSGIEIDYTVGDSASTIASKTNSILTANSDFITSVSGNIITITNVTQGVSSIASNGTASPGFTYTIITPGQGEDAVNKKVLISSLPTPSQQVDETSRSLIRVINRNASEILNAFYLSGPNDVPGLISFQTRDVAEPEFYLVVDSAATGSQFSPNLSPTNILTSNTVANPTVVTSSNHGLTSGNTIVISGSNSVPSIDGLQIVTVIDANTFSVPVNVTVAGTTGGWLLLTNANTSTNEIKPNRIYYSKFQQPEAVPIINFLDVGPQDKQILRILALRDNLFVLKQEAIYRISGQIAPFTLSLFDSSTILKGNDSAVILNNLIYLYSSQGVSTISDTGISVISRPIEDLLINLSTPQFTNFYSATFAVAYESDRSYYLYTVTNTTDVQATQCFRYNTFTQTWTNLQLAKSSGIVHPFDDLMYLGATDVNFIEQERKEFDRTDYADREIALSLSPGFSKGTSVVLPTLTNVGVGDVLVQVQYLTISQYNQLLSKLDNDVLLNPHNYVSSLTQVAGANLTNSLTNLITKIANDPGRLAVTGHTAPSVYTSLPTPIDFQGQQTTFNDLINLLNNDVGVGYKNYMSISSSVPFEFNIIAINKSLSTITTTYSYPLIQGPIIIYNSISTLLQWVPQFLGDVSMTKQISEGTYIFEDTSFSNATISYATDLSANFEDQIINGNTNGLFGNNLYGEGLYGGNGSGIPFRTYVPREKQRARYINCKFTHQTARELYYLYGMSLVYQNVSNRGWR